MLRRPCLAARLTPEELGALLNKHGQRRRNAYGSDAQVLVVEKLVEAVLSEHSRELNRTTQAQSTPHEGAHSGPLLLAMPQHPQCTKHNIQ